VLARFTGEGAFAAISRALHLKLTRCRYAPQVANSTAAKAYSAYPSNLFR